MPTIQQSIDIKVPVHALYNQLTQFEDYPQFMEEVETVQQIDDTHLHWKTVMSNRAVEWDAEITEQEPDRCIAWRNLSGPTNAGKVEVQSAGPDASRVTLTLVAEPEQVPGSPAGNNEQDMAQRLRMDLARLKEFMEGRGSETGAWRGEVHGGQVAESNQDAQQGTSTPYQRNLDFAATGRNDADNAGSVAVNTQVSAQGYGAGSEGFTGDEDVMAPMTSASRLAAEQQNDSAGSVAQAGTGAGAAPQDAQANKAPVEPERMQRPPGPGNTAAAVAAAGGTDASAGARASGSKGLNTSGPREQNTGPQESAKDDASVAKDNISPAAGAGAAGGTGLGSGGAGGDASDTRNA